MSTSFDLLTLDQLTQLGVDDFQNEFPTFNVAKTSDNWKRIRIFSGIGFEVEAFIDAVDRDALPDTAKGAKLIRWGSIFGVTQRGAAKASGTNAGLIRGSNGSSWATTDLLVHASGQTYAPLASGTLGASGESLVSLEAVTAGIDANLEAGEVLTWTPTTPSGLEDEVELQVALTGGLSVESEGSHRNRILNRIAQGAAGGNSNDYQQWALEADANAATAYVWSGRNGNGSVDIAALKSGTGAVRLFNGTERTAISAYIEARRPVSTGVVRVLEVTTESENIAVTVTPESGSEFAKDWNDSSPPTVSAWTSATRLLQFSAARPASMLVGHRIVIDGTSGVEMTIESLSSTDSVVLVSALGETPAASDTVYSGGPIVTPVRNAIQALFDALGPRSGDWASFQWTSTLYLSHMFEIIQTTTGVLDTEITAPSADVAPTIVDYPDSSTVNLLVAGNIVVRYA